LWYVHARQRPVVAWAVIGTTTAVCRGVQIWVVSNLWWETNGGASAPSSSLASAAAQESGKREAGGYWHRFRGGRWHGRRWDWREVTNKCVVPVAVCYLIMAWVGEGRRQFWGTPESRGC
jgi:hypothetical protein